MRRFSPHKQKAAKPRMGFMRFGVEIPEIWNGINEISYEKCCEFIGFLSLLNPKNGLFHKGVLELRGDTCSLRGASASTGGFGRYRQGQPHPWKAWEVTAFQTTNQLMVVTVYPVDE